MLQKIHHKIRKLKYASFTGMIRAQKTSKFLQNFYNVCLQVHFTFIAQWSYFQDVSWKQGRGLYEKIKSGKSTGFYRAKASFYCTKIDWMNPNGSGGNYTLTVSYECTLALYFLISCTGLACVESQTLVYVYETQCWNNHLLIPYVVFTEIKNK